MEYLIENWKIISAILGLVIAVIVFSLGLYAWFSGIAFGSGSVKEWTIQEAIFYGFSLLSFIHFLKG